MHLRSLLYLLIPAFFLWMTDSYRAAIVRDPSSRETYLAPARHRDLFLCLATIFSACLTLASIRQVGSDIISRASFTVALCIAWLIHRRFLAGLESEVKKIHQEQ